MTREEAIAVLDEWTGSGAIGEDCWIHFESDLDDVDAALYMAISALREQEERSKGCDWCEKDRVLCWDSGGEEVCIAQQGKLPVLGTDDWGFAVKFCPMCGRRLEEV